MIHVKENSRPTIADLLNRGYSSAVEEYNQTYEHKMTNLEQPIKAYTDGFAEKLLTLV